MERRNYLEEYFEGIKRTNTIRLYSEWFEEVLYHKVCFGITITRRYWL